MITKLVNGQTTKLRNKGPTQIPVHQMGAKQTKFPSSTQHLSKS